MEYVLYGIRKGNESWQEELITSTTDKNVVAKAKKWAKENGFDRFRQSIFNGEKPNFSKVVKK